MLAIFLAPVYILANVFTAYWLLRWMKEVHPLFRHPAVLGVILVLYAFFALSLLTSFLIKRDPVHRILKVISNCWLGMYLYFLGFTAILVLLRFIFAHTVLTKTWGRRWPNEQPDRGAAAIHIGRSAEYRPDNGNGRCNAGEDVRQIF